MFNSITWGQYFTIVALILSCYYLVTGYRYYRWEILSLIGIKKVESSAVGFQTVNDLKKSFATESNDEYLPKPALEIDISPLVQSFTDEVQAYLQETANNKIKEEELLNSIQLIASKYPALKDADCKEELMQFILNEINTKYPNFIQPDDLTRLWN
jgi:hypothetical protein